MVKIKNHNNGFTLVELVVSIAILGLIIIAISGVMFSNNIIFRKTKSDIDIQTIAQDTANLVTNDIMQAKYIYIEGTTCDTDLVFKVDDVGGDATGNLHSVKCVNKSDYLLMNSPTQYAQFISASGFFIKAEDLKDYREGLSTTVSEGEVYSPREKFDVYYNKIRYMSPSELGLYKTFVQDAKNSGANTYYASDSLKNSPNGYKSIYVNKMIIEYLVPLDKKYVDETDINSLDEDKRYATCKVTYELEKKKLTVTTEYSDETGENDMEQLNSSQVYTDCLNYLSVGSGGASADDVSGFVAKVDSEGNAMQLNMYFVKNGMRYNSENTIQFRNSYVVKDAN